MGSESTAKAGTSSWTLAHGINTHKLLAAPCTAGLMWYYSCYTGAAWTYLAMHGSYGVLWVAKDMIFPDKNFTEPIAFRLSAFVCVMLSLFYFGIPWTLMYQCSSVPVWFPAFVVVVFTTGMFLMMGSDCQKYYTLKAQPGKLITTGFFKYIRSPNYLGELVIYTSLSMLTFSVWGFIPTLWFLVTSVVPNLEKKDKSMSRYPEFAVYKASSYKLLPPLY